ncbi:MAG: HAD-IIIA family hydrolase [Fimbriimonadaceae bacterium]|nr:HAD-IIIA family hydrolase [Fimbriimonadaceae bacterium]
MSRLLLLDRDGVLNEDVGYAWRMEQICWHEPGVELARFATQYGWDCVIVTNQSGIARGQYRESDFRLLMRDYVSALANYGVRIAATYYCPHHPEFTGVCTCRKPEPGMLRAAMRRFGVTTAVMVGDQPTDLEAAARAGIRGIRVDDAVALTDLRREIARSNVQ